MSADLRSYFETLITEPDDALDVAQAALWVARIGRPGVDVEAAISRLDALAEAAREELHKHQEHHRQVVALCDFLRDSEGFRGNDVDFSNAENSFLDVVLDTRTGIPIALGVIYIAVGRRLGLDIEGVNFPGHFVVRARPASGAEIFVDPFAGTVVDEATLAERVRRLRWSETGELKPEHLAAAPTRAIVARMLNNLKIMCLQQSDFARALVYCDWMVELMPHNPVELRDRALILVQLEAFEAAANDYEKLVELLPDESAKHNLKNRIRELRKRAPKTLH